MKRLMTNSFRIFLTLLALTFSVAGITPAQAAESTTDPALAAGAPILPGQTPDGLTSVEWMAVQESIAAAEYHFAYHNADETHAVPYYWAPNRAQGWQTVFSSQGIQVTAPDSDWMWGLRLAGYGYPSSFSNLSGLTPVLTASQATLTYGWDANLSEWWANNSQGLEQGFTLQSRPDGQASGQPLRIDLAVTGNLMPVQRGDAIAFVDSAGVLVLTYDKLYVTDAVGRVLPARMELAIAGQVVRLSIDDTNALYPLTIDPWVQTAKLTASDGIAGDYFGVSVAVSGDTVVVGAAGHNSRRGSAYIYVKSGADWASATQTAKLTASDGAISDEFGYSVAISGDTVVVGAWADDTTAMTNHGSAYIYVKPGAGWTSATQTAKLTASDRARDDEFGKSIAVSGDTVVVGSWGDDDLGSNSGSVYVYVKPDTGWTTTNVYTAKLTAGDGAALDYFGQSVAISGDTLVVGALYDDDMGSGSGSAYVYVKPGTGWATTNTYTAKLTASDGAASDNFGASVAVSDDTLVVGVPLDDIGSNVDQGSAYLYVKPGAGWATTSETAKLTASDGATNDYFGQSVAVSGDAVVAGAYGDDSFRGSAYLYVKSDTGWSSTTETAKLIASGVESNEYSCYSVALSGDTLVVGAEGDDGAIGSAYVFNLVSRTVTFNANGGEGAMDLQTSSAPAALIPNTFTRAGYIFSGWNTTLGGTGTAYADGATYDFAADVTLYAQWTALPSVTITSSASDPTNVSPIPLTITFDQLVNGLALDDFVVGNGAVSNLLGSGAGVGPRYAQVSAGYYHNCGLVSDGSLQCWGQNDYGQTMVPALGSGLAYTGVSAGAFHTCGSVSDGSLKCWGWNYSGQTAVPVLGDGLTYTAVSAGARHTCGLVSDGSLQCWGLNDYGQTMVPALGDGLTYTAVSGGGRHTCGLISDGSIQCWGLNDYSQTTVPALGGGLTYAAVSGGGRHTCGLVSDGSIQCWGLNDYSQTTVPAAQGGLTYTEVSTGYSHTCGLVSDGSLQCWGYDDYGQATVPALGEGLAFAGVSVGGSYHSCGLISDGSLQCWGWNNYGQITVPALPPLYYTTYTANITPTAPGAVAVDLPADSAQNMDGLGNLAATQFSILYAPEYTVSFNAQGGTPTPDSQTVAFGALVSDPGNPTRTGYAFNGWFSAASGGEQWDFATDTMGASNMTLYAQWAANTYTVSFDAQGGTPTPDNQTVAFGALVSDPGNPTRTGYAFNGWFSAASGSAQWNFATDTMGAGNMTLYAQWTALPSVTITSSASDPTSVSPIPLTITFDQPVDGLALDDLIVGNGIAGSLFSSGAGVGLRYTQVSAGVLHTCGLASDGSLQCWGWNDYSQSTVPALAGGLTYTGVAAGGVHTCGLISDGSLQCWGVDWYGQNTVPTLDGGLTYTAVSAGNYATCGLVSDGSLQCWGSNNHGQITVPALGGGLTYTAAGVGDYHTCGLVSDGSLQCWGRNLEGQTTVPTLGDGLIYTAVSTGSFHTCGLVSDGSLQCWGDSSFDQTAVPALGNGLTYTAFGSGRYHTCGLVSDGSLQCWGYNDFGQTVVPALGDGLTYIAVSLRGGGDHTCGLVSDGSLRCWGYDAYGQTSAPALPPLSYTTYTANITPTAPGAVTVDLPADSAQNMAGLGNLAAIQFSILYVPEYTVSFNVQGGTPTPDNQTVAFGALVSDPGNPTRAGYTFNGWFSAASGGARWDFATDTMGAGNMTLYAQWTDSTYPTIASVARASASPTDAVSVDFTVTFSEIVTGVETSDFVVSGTVSGASVIGTTPVSGSVYTVSVNTGLGNGSLRLDIPDTATITDIANNPLVGLPYINGETYVISKNGAPTDISLSKTSLAEGQPSGTVVGSFTTDDPDAGDIFVYSLTAGAGDADNAAFAISGNSLITIYPFNYWAKDTYLVRVRVTDGGGLSFEESFSISVTDMPTIFLDVPDTYWAVTFIERLYQFGITGGCIATPLSYCPESMVTRAQMAVFLERGIHGSSFVPPDVSASFGDTAGHWAEDWIEALLSDGITIGCGNGNYCPEEPVTRAQIAVFLLRAKYGMAYTPPSLGGDSGFGDVSVDHWAASWIKQLAAEGITGGCGNGNYCPEEAVTRAQMAIFLVRTFNLP